MMEAFVVFTREETSDPHALATYSAGMTVPPTKPSLLNALPVPVTAPLSLKGGGDIPTEALRR